MAKFTEIPRTVVPIDSIRAITLTKPVTSLPSLAALRELPSYRARAACMYKRFHRLKNVIDRDTETRQVYCDLVRHRFAVGRFNELRSELLGAGVAPIAHDSDEHWRRVINTYAFVHNATVRPDEVSIDESKVVYEDDLSRLHARRIEKSIVLGMLRVHDTTPDRVKLDFSLRPLRDIQHVVESISPSLSKKQERKLFADTDPNNITYRDHLVGIMRLNESCKLCL